MENSPTAPPTVIPFDSLTLRAVAAELNRHLRDGQIQDIRQPTATELQFGIRSQGRNYLLLLSAHARFARLHLVGTRLPNAAKPPQFCMILRKHLENGIIRDIRQRGFDRIIEIEVESRDAMDEPIFFTLVGEFMGKHSNLTLLNANQIIVDAIKRVTHRVNRLRETLPGLPYQSPPAQSEKTDPFVPNAANIAAALLPTMAREEFPARLLSIFAGMSPFLAQEIAARTFADNAPDGEIAAENLRRAWRDIFGAAAADAFDPVFVRSIGLQSPGAYPFPIVQVSAESQEPASELNFALEEAFEQTRQRAEIAARAGDLRGKIEREIKRLNRHAISLEKTLAEAERAEEHKQAGELLLANLWRIEPNAAAVTVQDYYDPELRDRILTLEPKLSAQENADAYFRRYHKARDGAERANQETEIAAAALHTLAAAQDELRRHERAGDTEAVQILRDALLQGGIIKSQEASGEDTDKLALDLQGYKIKRVTTPDGFDILIGESAVANDYLTTRIALPNDLWFHVRAAASSHVIIRTHGQPQSVPRPVLEYAAQLCARHSSQKHSSLIAVDYTLKKYVRKPRGAAPGSADYQREITLHITL